MTDVEHLPNAPLLEAVIDLRVANATPLTLSDLEAFRVQCVAEFPIEEQLFSGTVQIKMSGPGEVHHTDVESEPIGYRFWTEDRTWAMQVRTGGLTMSKMPPYDRWETLRERARAWWRRYQEALRPDEITRAAVRYINRLELPHVDGSAQLDTYLQSLPNLPAGVSNSVTGFLTRIALQDEATGASLQITQSTEVTSEASTALVLDIDVFVNQSFDPESDECWDILDRLRDLKNSVFFGSITEETKRLYL